MNRLTFNPKRYPIDLDRNPLNVNEHSFDVKGIIFNLKGRPINKVEKLIQLKQMMSHLPHAWISIAPPPTYRSGRFMAGFR